MQRAIAYAVALVVSVVGVFVGVQVVAANTTAFDRFKGGTATTTTTVDLGPAPAPGQAFVKGTVDRLTAERAQAAAIATPFTLTAVERGVGKVTIENALVEGKRTTIAWDGGTPLPISGEGGSIDLAGAKVDVDATGSSWAVDGGKALKPGIYRVGATVAVGEGGLARPRDSVSFSADARTVINGRGGVVLKVPPARQELKGPGKVSAAGQFQVREERTRTPASRFQFGEGPYTVVINPVNGRLEIDAVLQGPLTRS
ncbi:MAG TPA: hypothetical protein VM388_06675 [Acidimicrobiales bacterium]|nr:hypothetical protein [Acidimicrobiales bacterium]HWI04461.1 hypothetical protein [Acidimicrobiales bacterium]